MWDKILKFYTDNKDFLDLLLGSGVIFVVLGGIVTFTRWLLKEYRLRKIRTNDNFPFKIIPPNSNVAKEILGGADDDPLADRNIPYQQRALGRNTRRELEELIEDHRWILITGRTGLGKTREAVQLAQSLNNEGWTILFLTRDAWLESPAILPNNVPERKLLFLLDDLNKKCHSSKVEVRPDASESLTIPINEPFQMRLQRTLETFQTFCGKSEVRVIATVRNEKISEFDEPSEWEKLEWTKYNMLWGKFKPIDLLEPDDNAEENLLAEAAKNAEIIINLDYLPIFARNNDGTFRNLVENLSSAKAEDIELSSDNFRDTLKGTWKKRYQKAIQKHPEAKHIYDAIELARNINIQINISTILQIAEILSKKTLVQRIKSRRKYSIILKDLIKSENILNPRDEQIESKGYRIKTNEYLPFLYKQIWLSKNNKRGTFIEQVSVKFYLMVRLILTPRWVLLPNKDLGSKLGKVLLHLLHSDHSLMLLAFKYRKLGFKDYSNHLFEKSLSIHNYGFSFFDGPSYHFLVANYALLDFSGNPNDAINICRKAIVLFPKVDIYWFIIGAVSYNLKQYDDAIQAFQKAIELNPKDNSWWMHLGAAYRAIKKYDDALHAFTKSIELNSNNKECWEHLGHTHLKLLHFTDAINAYRKAIKLGPKDETSWDNLGSIYRQLQQYNEAIQAYQKAIELNPKFESAWHSLGTIYIILNNTDDALIAYQKAVDISPDKGIYRASLVGILRKLGREDEAIEQEKVARSFIDKENEYNRACFECICGNMEDALDLLQIALEQKQTSIEWAQKDPDFELIRGNQRFKELVGLK